MGCGVKIGGNSTARDGAITSQLAAEYDSTPPGYPSSTQEEREREREAVSMCGWKLMSVTLFKMPEMVLLCEWSGYS